MPSTTDRWGDISDAEWLSRYGVTAEQIDAVADGLTAYTFGPSVPVSRAQAAKMVVEGFAIGTLLVVHRPSGLSRHRTR